MLFLDRIKIMGEPIIRPSTLAKYAKIKLSLPFNYIEIYDLTRSCVELGMECGVCGDVVFILSIFIYDNILKGSRVNTFIEFDLETITLDTLYKNINLLYDKIMQIISLEDPTYIKYSKIKGLTMLDLIYNVMGYRYTGDYTSYGEALLYNDTYGDNFESLYLEIFESEKYLLIQKGDRVNTFDKSDIEKYRSNYKNTFANNITPLNREIKCIVTFKSDSKLAMAILLSNKYNCPFVKDVGQDLSIYDDIILADEI